MKLKLHVVPNSSENKICGLYGDALKIKIKAPPTEGKANEEIISFFSGLLSIPNRDIKILHGSTGQKKLIEISISPEQELYWKNQFQLK